MRRRPPARTVRALLVALAAIVSGAWTDPPQDEVGRAVVDEAIDSVGRVRSAGRNGSGWIIGRDTVVTNLHVARGGTGDIFIDFSDGESVECYTAAADRDRDLAIVKCPTGDRPVLAVDSAPPPVGTAVVAIGYPGGKGPTVSAGQITDHDVVVRGITTTGYTAATAPGSSGSPVIDAAGRVRAVVTFSGGRGVPSADLPPLVERASGLPSTKSGAEWRLRLQRSVAGAVVLAALRYVLLWRRGRRPRARMVGALQAAAIGALLALAVTQVQFMAAGPTLY